MKQDINSRIAALSLEQKVGQLLHPFIRPEAGMQWIDDWFGGVEVGGAFFFPAERTVISEIAQTLQARARVPIVFSSDLENGAGRMVKDATVFPDNMSLAATANDEYAYGVGKAAAREGRACGMHWSFGPVVDINKNPHNPITNTRGFGDDPGVVARFGRRMIRGMQDHGMAATAKHFPGDGYDDRDQHLATTVNPLSREEWYEQSGRMFREAIAEDVWTIMPGHIALPSFDAGEAHAGASLSPVGGSLPGNLNAPPAVMSKKLITDLLRGELGFKGLVITDAIEMGGSVSWFPGEEVVVRAIEAGCDMILFSRPKRDFDAIMAALASGRLTETRIDESVRRVFELKEKLGLLDGAHTNALPPAEERSFYSQLSVKVARESLTEVRRDPATRPEFLKPGMKVLSLHIRGDELYNVDGMDKLLSDAKTEVIRRTENDPFFEVAAVAKTVDAVVIHLVFGPSWGTGRIRMAGNYNRIIMEIQRLHVPRCIYISYGSPYHLYDYPRAANMLNAYSPDANTQTAVADYLFGRVKAPGKSPVDLDKLLQGIGRR